MIPDKVRTLLELADELLCSAADAAANEKDPRTQGRIMEVQMELDKLTENDEPLPEDEDEEDEDNEEDEEDEEDDEEFIDDETEDDDVDAGDENDDEVI